MKANEEHIAQTKKRLYEEQVQEAAEDERFRIRTIDCNKDFIFIDEETIT